MSKRFPVLSVISLGHFAVDTACVMMVTSFSAGREPVNPVLLVLLYDFLAFATQPVIGYLSDNIGHYGRIASLGCILTLAGIFLNTVPMIAVIISGLGNALFHVGGGVISLKLDRGKAWAPGIFIAPGTLGVFVGTFIGKSTYLMWPFIILLLLLAAAHYILKDTPTEKKHSIFSSQNLQNQKLFYPALVLILLTVVVRSYAGMAISYAWKSDITLSLIITTCIMLGKALGGILSDRFGLLGVPLAGLILSVPCLALGLTSSAAGSIGMFLLNLTMPVTLLLTARLFPNNLGLGFGMTVLSLSAGTIPAFSGMKLTSPLPIVVVVLFSAVTFFFGFALYRKMNNPLCEES